MPFGRRNHDDADDRSRIISGEPFRAEPQVDHHDGEHTVEVANFPSRFGADVAVAALAARGIKAAAVHSDNYGSRTNRLAHVGHRVVVFEKDFEVARALLVEEDVTPEDAD